jgi:hypothetical protein
LQKFGGWFTWAVGMKDFPLPSINNTLKEKIMKTKFNVGDIIKDTMCPLSETLKVLAIERVKENPFVTNVWYFFESNRGKRCNGLQSIIEHPGRFEKVC